MVNSPNDREVVVAPTDDPGGLKSYEFFWRDHQPWLRERGYELRIRYHPDWTPSWKGTNKRYTKCEDGWLIRHPMVLDATRISDGEMVSLKRTSKSKHPHEADIAQFLSSGALTHDPHNYCVPIYEVLHVPSSDDDLIIVMPLLRNFQNPRFETVGEAVELFQQLINGLRFMHEHRVAHRDISDFNVMMDPRAMFPQMYHPIATSMKRDYSGRVKYCTRTERPTRYYYVDFGLSRMFSRGEDNPQELPILGGDKTVPEFQGDGYDRPHNPFYTDVYYLGNLIRESFLQVYFGVEFMEPLITEMVQDDPGMRPTMNEVVARFKDVKSSLTAWRLRRRLTRKKDPPIARFAAHVIHCFRTVGYIVRRYPSVPTPAMLSPLRTTTSESIAPLPSASLSSHNDDTVSVRKIEATASHQDEETQMLFTTAESPSSLPAVASASRETLTSPQDAV